MTTPTDPKKLAEECRGLHLIHCGDVRFEDCGLVRCRLARAVLALDEGYAKLLKEIGSLAVENQRLRTALEKVHEEHCRKEELDYMGAHCVICEALEPQR